MLMELGHMVQRLRFPGIVGCILVEAVCLRGQGYIVPNGVTDAGDSGGLCGNIHVIQNPTNPGVTDPPSVRLCLGRNVSEDEI